MEDPSSQSISPIRWRVVITQRPLLEVAKLRTSACMPLSLSCPALPADGGNCKGSTPSKMSKLATAERVAPTVPLCPHGDPISGVASPKNRRAERETSPLMSGRLLSLLGYGRNTRRLGERRPSRWPSGSTTEQREKFCRRHQRRQRTLPWWWTFAMPIRAVLARPAGRRNVAPGAEVARWTPGRAPETLAGCHVPSDPSARGLSPVIPHCKESRSRASSLGSCPPK